MSQQDPHEPATPEDDALDRIVTTLRDQAMPDGPSPQLVRRTQAALRDATRGSGRGALGRIMPAGPRPRLAAAIVLLALGALVFWAIFGSPSKPLQTHADPPKVLPRDPGGQGTSPTPPPVV